MPPKASDLHEKAVTAGTQLREALISASEALKTIADIVPTLYSSAETTNTSAPSKPKQKAATSISPEVEQTNTTVAPPSSNKRKRKEKDPDAPEKPPSAYHLYAKEKRDDIKAAMPGTPSGNDVVLEINRRWKELADELKKTYVEAAEKLKGPYQYAMAEYEKFKGQTSDKPNEEPVQKPAEAMAPAPTKSKSTPRKGGGFTAVQASPLALNPEGEANSDDDSEDEAAVAAELGGAQPSASASPTKRQKKESSKPTTADSVKKDKKEKAKDKDKDKDKDKRKRRKSGKADA